jgi:RHS repeat-associated protein
MSWDVENRLVAMWRGPWLAQGSNSTVEELVAWNPLVGTVWRWGYDHRTRRVWRNEPGPEGLGRVTSVVAFSGGTSVAEFSDETLSLLLARGVDIGGGTRGLLWTARRETGSAETGSTVTLRFNRYNSRGDVVGQSDAAGVTTWAATYQADGRRTGEIGTNLNPKHATGRVRELGVNRDRHRANCLPKATRDAASGLVFRAAFAAGRSKEEDPTGLLNEGFRYRDMETGTFISRDPLGHVDGPNVYCYVRQNPWTMWDPEGLESESEAHWKRQSKSSENGLAYQAYAGFRLAAAALNPFSGGSSMRDANRQFGAGINTAVDSINNAQIPELMKSVAKFGLGVGGSGHALNPISTTSGASEVVDAVKKHGAGTVLKQVGASIRNDALNNPEKLFGELLVGWASGVAVNSAVRIPFRPLGGSATNSAPRVRVNIFGECEARGFLDVSTNTKFANGRPLTSGLASGSADDIFLRFSPASGENTISEIMRLSKPGTRVTVLEGAGGGQGALLKEAFGDAAETTLQRSFNSQTIVPGTPLEMLKLRVK